MRGQRAGRRRRRSTNSPCLQVVKQLGCGGLAVAAETLVLRRVMDDAPGRSVDGWDHCLGALPRTAWTGWRHQSVSVCIRSSGVMNVEMSELGVHGSARRRVRSFSDHPWISGGSYVRSSQPQ